ncbi:DUF934 domain-containing protein [Stappia sp. F7233]|uniref:DUF934 domain-containing protein n=1 Tax=Stappia albiluteola TaxID=2758565 RepID=A0A839AFA7_9HYPH|nr:DUF934 domain-containing protein [Stappia albiluteola]MBA5778311.1 DUF934 domain-containing protein [Stappia albiluteola]
MADTIYRNGAFEADSWLKVADDEALPAEGQVLLSLERFLSIADENAEGLRVGVVLKAGERAQALEGRLEAVALIAIEFPKFSDGRGYSSARLLREKHGYQGELRAIGDVLLDQIPFMIRCGIDSFEVVNEPTRRALVEGHSVEVPVYLQPVGRADEVPLGTRPWARRHVAAQRVGQQAD